MNNMFVGTILCLALSLVACGGQPTPFMQTPPPAAPTEPQAQPSPDQLATSQPAREISFSQDVLPIFQQFAGGSHGNKGGLSLETYDNVTKVVVAGDPESSKLYQRLTGQGGPVMPPGGKLPDDLIQTIYQWIKQGAKNN